jgi:sugar phosphate isomerase/epimerase
MTAAATGLAGCMTGGEKKAACDGKGKILFGVCRPLKDAKILKAHGYDFFETSVAGVLMPTCSEEQWKKQKELILNAPIPLRSCNGFLPGTFRLTGPKADFAPALDYAEKALRRAEEVGVKTIVFGSGGARNVPGDICSADRSQRPDTEKGLLQYTEFCRILCNRVSDLKNVSMVIEPLRPNESNIINYVWQGMQVVREVNSYHLKELADIFHMISGKESAASLIDAGCDLKHCHIACKGTRQFPGTRPDDAEIFKPYFDALKQIGYTGGVSCECGWPKEKVEFEKALEKALALMKSLA